MASRGVRKPRLPASNPPGEMKETLPLPLTWLPCRWRCSGSFEEQAASATLTSRTRNTGRAPSPPPQGLEHSEFPNLSGAVDLRTQSLSVVGAAGGFVTPGAASWPPHASGHTPLIVTTRCLQTLLNVPWEAQITPVENSWARPVASVLLFLALNKIWYL